jgi:pectate lyase
MLSANMTFLCRWLAAILFTLQFQAAFALPAFPGAEGAGGEAVGGRGGDVYFVTNTNNTGAGSLRNGITSASGPRTIIFKVSGNIDLQSNLAINKPYLTIAGQTAPGDGITLRRRTVSVQDTHDVIVRFIRCRSGDLDSTFEDDSFHTVNVSNVIADHLSSSWSIDECTSVTWSTNVTIQWCMITESLKNSQHPKGAHGYGTLLRYGDGALTFHHNLYEAHDSRNPRLGDRVKLDFVNNVLYNWGGRAGYSGGNGPTEDAKDNPGGVFTNYLNYINNYLVAGPSSTTPNTAFASGATNTVIYQSGNRIDSNKNLLLDGTDTGWGMFNGFPYTLAASPYPIPPVTADPATNAYERVLAFVGHYLSRDSVDLRLIGNVRNHTGRLADAVGPADQSPDYVTNNINGTNYVFVPGWPVLSSTTPPADFDNDGMPDYWELAMGLNTNNAADRNNTDATGYTMLENYLNWLGSPHAVAGRNGTLDVNLRRLIGVTNDFIFAVTDGTNGTASLLGDGYTARFVTAPNYSGLADFKFTATDSTNLIGFGPVAFNILVATTNVPGANTPPTLDPVTNRTVVAGVTVNITCTATDTNSPTQTLTYALFNPPAGATFSTNAGVFNWRPAIAQGGSAYPMSVAVSDDGTPSMSATQSFTITVTTPVQPALQQPSSSNGQFSLLVNGDAGPDYVLQASTNLVNWTNIFTTNSPPLPFLWNDDSAGNFNQRFYRVLLSP